MRSVQAPSAVVMIRPHNFRPNPATESDNGFQSRLTGRSCAAIAADAYAEVSRAAAALSDAGVQVHLFEDTGDGTPDSVFPNNWFSTHAGGHVAIFPMFSTSRRAERRADIIEMLKAKYRVQEVIDYSGLEADNLFLEGTGAMVLDHVERIAYAARSNRTDPVLLERFCTNFNFEPMLFDAFDRSGTPIYHTNVMMCIGTRFALVGLDTIADHGRRGEVRGRLEASGREVISLDQTQLANFAGNAIELLGREGTLLALSERALQSLTTADRAVVEAHARILSVPIPTIEAAGGSIRCMVAGVHLAAR